MFARVAGFLALVTLVGSGLVVGIGTSAGAVSTTTLGVHASSGSPGGPPAGGGSSITYQGALNGQTSDATGTITFSIGTTTLCVADVSGSDSSSTCSTSDTPVGDDQTVTGVYSGDSNNSSSSGTTTVSVAPPYPAPPPGATDSLSDTIPGSNFAGDAVGNLSVYSAAGSYGSLTLAQYGSNPTGVPVPGVGTNAFYDVALASGSEVSGLTISYCDRSSAFTSMDWFDGTSWVPFSSVVPPNGRVGEQCGSATVTTGTSPTPAQLTGTPIAIGFAPPPGYWLVGSDGGIFNFGSAGFYGSTGSLKLNRPVVGISPVTGGTGYWLVASDGGIFAFDAPFVGSIPGLGINPYGSGLPHSLAAPIVGMVPANGGQGYFLVGSDGGVFAFNAHFAGSCPGIGGCAGEAVAVVPDATGNGYWVVTSTGNVYSFGDAGYYGAPGRQSTPITSAVATPDGMGYWILDGAGQVFHYGDATSQGSVQAGAVGGLDPASAIFAGGDDGGYWVATAEGKVYGFGDLTNLGDMSAYRLNGSIIAASGF